MRYPNVEEISHLLETEWANDFTFDHERALNEGVIILQWKATKQPVPINFEISERFFAQEFMTRREFLMRIKEYLPETMLKQLVSEANRLLRDANRRAIKEVERDLKKWIIKSAELITNIYGVDQGKLFGTDIPLPTGVKSGTIRAVQFVVEKKIDLLKDL